MKLKIFVALLFPVFFKSGSSFSMNPDVSIESSVDPATTGFREARVAKISKDGHTSNIYSFSERRKGKQSPHTPVLAFQDFEVHLKGLITKLRCFFNETNFDSTIFQKESQNLKEELFEIETSIQMAQVDHMFSRKISWRDNILPQKLTDLLRFASHMMHTMKECSDGMLDTSKKANLIQHLVRSVLQQKVRLLMLIDDRGNPNVKIVGYMQKVDLHAAHLKYWHGLFNEAKNIPFQQRLEFQHQYYQAKSAIGILQMAVYSQKRWT